MKKMRIRQAAIAAMAVMIGTTIISGATQLGTKKTLDVWSGALKISYNSRDITSQVTPIVVNNTTYLPLRSMANLFGKSISYNNATAVVTLTDTTGTGSSDSATIAQLKQQLAEKDAEIARLKSQLGESSDISSIQSTLNKTYKTYRSTKFEFSLSGNSSTVKINIDTDKDDWEENFTSSKQKTFLQLVCDAVRKEYSSAVITGTVKDGSKTLTSFYATSLSGTVKISDSSDDDDDAVEDMEDALNDKLKADKFGTLTDIDNDDLKITLDGDTDSVTFKIKIDLGDYGSKWDDLDNDDIEDFMGEIYEYIEDDDDFEDAEITGYFYDEDDKENLVKCYFSGSKLKFKYY